jgi:hypothetical protein
MPLEVFMFTRWQPRLILGIALVFTLGADEPSPAATQNRRVACGQSETFEEKATAGQTGGFTIAACDCGPGTAAHVTLVKDGTTTDLCTATAGGFCMWTVPPEGVDGQIVLGCDGTEGSGSGCLFEWPNDRARPTGVE